MVEFMTENQRLRRIEDALAAAVDQALRNHHSPAGVSQALANALQGAVASLIEELDELVRRVSELEDLLEVEGPGPVDDE